MEGLDILNKLNAYETWTEMALRRRLEAAATISALAEVFQRVGSENREFISKGLSGSAKLGMAYYTQEKAVEAMRTGSKTAVIEGLVPVVMAGGRSDTRTGGALLSLLLHSAERSGLDARELFGYAAQFASDPAAAAQIRDYPLLPRKLTDIARYGFHERKTPQGLTYEHAVESMSRPSWWDKLLLRRRGSRETTLQVQQESDRHRKDEP